MDKLGAVEEFYPFDDLIHNESVMDILKDLLSELCSEITQWHYGDRLP